MDLVYLLPAFMFLALAALLFSGFPVAWVLGGVGIGFGFIGMYYDVFEFIYFFNVISRIWGTAAENLILVAVPMFIFMGTMLERSGVANDLLHCLQVLLRRTPGGLALSVTIMGTIMAATTGIIGASVVMMTLLALPVMLERGYHVPLATGTIAASGTLGILIPPVGRSFVPPILLIVFVLGSIFAGWATPTEAAGVGALGALLLAVMNRKLNYRVLKDVLIRSALTIGMIFGIFLGATCFSYVYRVLGGDDVVHNLIMNIGLGDWGLLFLMMGMVFVLGFFFDWIEITLIVLPLFSPIMRAMDFGTHIPYSVDIVPWITILLAVNLQTSFLTPPFGFALFYMKGVAPPQVKMQQIYRGIIPFVTLQLIGLGFVIGFPQLALWLPHSLLD